MLKWSSVVHLYNKEPYCWFCFLKFVILGYHETWYDRETEQSFYYGERRVFRKWYYMTITFRWKREEYREPNLESISIIVLCLWKQQWRVHPEQKSNKNVEEHHTAGSAKPKILWFICSSNAICHLLDVCDIPTCKRTMKQHHRNNKSISCLNLEKIKYCQYQPDPQQKCHGATLPPPTYYRKNNSITQLYQQYRSIFFRIENISYMNIIRKYTDSINKNWNSNEMYNKVVWSFPIIRDSIDEAFRNNDVLPITQHKKSKRSRAIMNVVTSLFQKSMKQVSWQSTWHNIPYRNYDTAGSTTKNYRMLTLTVQCHLFVLTINPQWQKWIQSYYSAKMNALMLRCGLKKNQTIIGNDNVYVDLFMCILKQ
jgi:hypothetical protein